MLWIIWLLLKSSDDDDDDRITFTEPTNNKMDMSHIDFGNKNVDKKDDSADSQEDQSSKIQDENE